MMPRALHTIAKASLAILVMLVCVSAFFWSRPDLLCRIIGNTAYSAGYTEAAFWSVAPGMTMDQVTALLGDPISVQRGHQQLIYCAQDADEVRLAISCSSNAVDAESRQPLCVAADGMAAPRSNSLTNVPTLKYPVSLWSGPFAELRGHSEWEIRAKLGPPLRIETDFPDLEVWNYSYSPTSTHYIRRAVSFDAKSARVTGFFSDPYWD